MATEIEAKVLNVLIDSFERSKTFIGENVNEQNFKVSVSKLFPRYDDDSEFTFYKELNNTVEALKKRGFIAYSAERSGKIKTVFLVKESIPEIYVYLKRQSKTNINDQLLAVWNEYQKSESLIYRPLVLYIEEQRRHLSENKPVSYFDGNIDEYKNILSAVKAVLQNDSETFIRELSVKLYNDSKYLESIESKVRTLLFRYGDYDDRESVLEEHNVIKTPTYVMVKGKGILECGRQSIDLSQIDGDIGLSTKTLKSVSSINLNGANVMTVENLTNFHNYVPDNEMVIYLGGFHNSVKRDFIKLVSEFNSKAKFRHFGDIDAGGFYILEHLICKTGVYFSPYHMDVDTLENYKDSWIPLSENDKIRLNILLEKTDLYRTTIEYMLRNNCKLEQESEM